MFNTVLVGYDGSSQAQDALALASALASDDSELILCCVHPFQPMTAAVVAGEHDVPGRDEAERRLGQGVEQLQGRARVRTLAVAATSGASGLHAVAEREGADLLVVGPSHRSPLGRVFLGATTSQALNAPPCSVAIAPAGLAATGAAPLRHITVAFDGGAEARRALAVAAELAREGDASLKLLTVVEPVTRALGWSGAFVYPEYREDAMTIAREAFEDAQRTLDRDLNVETSIVEGIAEQELVLASSQTDLLVLGSRGYGPIQRLLLGAVSTRVANAAAGPVLVAARGNGKP